jgi:hypothetical protein
VIWEVCYGWFDGSSSSQWSLLARFVDPVEFDIQCFLVVVVLHHEGWEVVDEFFPDAGEDVDGSDV